MEKEFSKKGVATFGGLTIGKSGAVQLKFKLRYDEIVTSINLLQGLNTDITIVAKIPDKKAMSLGIFTIGSMNFDRDGNATIPFKSLVDSVNLDNICQIVEEEYIKLKFMAVLELPDNEVKEVEGKTEETDDEEGEEETEGWED